MTGNYESLDIFREVSSGPGGVKSVSIESLKIIFDMLETPIKKRLNIQRRVLLIASTIIQAQAEKRINDNKIEGKNGR